MDQQLYDRIQELQRASFFRKRMPDGNDRIVDAPFFSGSASSAFERLPEKEDAVVEVGRLGVHNVHYLCWGIDPVAESLERISELPAYKLEGAITVRRMSGGRC